MHVWNFWLTAFVQVSNLHATLDKIIEFQVHNNIRILCEIKGAGGEDHGEGLVRANKSLPFFLSPPEHMHSTVYQLMNKKKHPCKMFLTKVKAWFLCVIHSIEFQKSWIHHKALFCFHAFKSQKFWREKKEKFERAVIGAFVPDEK